MRILWISDSIDGITGFGNESYTLLSGLKECGHDIVTMAWDTDTEKRFFNIPIHPLYGSFSNSVKLILRQYYNFDPDIIMSYADIHSVQHMIMDIRDTGFKNKWVHWLPVDGDPYPENQDALYQELKHLVVASQFGFDVFKDHYKGDLKLIYNAIDPQDYYPMNNRYETEPKEFRDKFICLFVGQNQSRKKIPLLINGFSKFAAGKNDVALVLHTPHKSVKLAFQGWNLPYLIEQYGLDIEKNVFISRDVMTRPKLNRLYNCSDVFVSATGGEGFNLPAAEAMMAGVPLLLPDFTTGPEFVNSECGDLIKISEYIYEGSLNIRKAIISTDDLADKLNKMYLIWKKGELKQSGTAAHDRAMKMFQKNDIVQQWNKTIKDISKTNAIRQINVSKSIRTEKKVLFIDDINPDKWVGGTQLSTKKITDTAKDFGFDAKCVTLEECDISELYSADLIVLNNIYDTAERSPNLIAEITSNLPYVKWEHDFNFCATRDFRCFGKTGKCETKCPSEQFVEIYANAKSVVFQSPLHHKAFLQFFGDKIIKNHIILPPPVDPDLFIKSREQNRKSRFLWTGLMHPFRGIEEAIEFAKNNPKKQFLFHSAYPPVHKKYTETISSLPNCELRIEQIPYEKMPELFASCSDLFYQPKYIDASSRTALEALFSGCRLRPNDNVGLLSYNWDWSNTKDLTEKIKNAPKIFWDHIKDIIPKIKQVQLGTVKSKINIVFFPSGSKDDHLPSSAIRVYTVSDVLNKLGYNTQIVDPNLPDEIKYSVLSDLRSNDIVYVQKTFCKFNRAKNFKHIKGRNVIIYDVDDYYPERNENKERIYLCNSDEMAMLADMVIVGAHRLARWNGKNNKNIKVIASLVDDTIYLYKPRKEKSTDQVRILWTEKIGKRFLEDLLMIKDVLTELHKKYGCQFVFQSFAIDEIDEVQELFPFAKILPLVNFRDYVDARVPLMQDCDFFIAPFKTGNEEREIENVYKAGQNSRHMMGLGLPGVASPVAEHDYFIEDGINGFLAKTPQEWYEKIEKLIVDNALRIQMGMKSRETIEKKYTINKTIRQLLEAVHGIKNKYFTPTLELTSVYEHKALVTIKYGSFGGGTLTSKHIRDILESVGYKTNLIHCGKYKGSSANYVFQVNEQKLKDPMLLREYAKKYPVDVFYFDDIDRFEKEATQFAEKSFLVLCGCANVHTTYYTNPMIIGGATDVNRVFVKNYALYKYLNSFYGNKFVYWQGGIDGQVMRQRYGKASYRDPKEGVLLTSSFSSGWWKNPTMASLAAYAVWRKYPKTKYFKPILNAEDIEFARHSQMKIIGNRESIPREQLLETLVQSQLGLEIYLADAFPRTLLDHFSLGVPMITSNVLTFLNEYPILYDNLVVQNPNDPLSIYQKALTLLEDKEKWETVSAACIEFTRQHSFQAESDVLIKYSGLKLPEGKEIQPNIFLEGINA